MMILAKAVNKFYWYKIWNGSCRSKSKRLKIKVESREASVSRQQKIIGESLLKKALYFFWIINWIKKERSLPLAEKIKVLMRQKSATKIF